MIDNISVPVDVEHFDEEISSLTNIVYARAFLWKHIAPSGVQKTPGTIVTLDVFDHVIIVDQVDVGLLQATISHIADDLATIASQIDLKIKIRDIKHGKVWSEAERKLFIRSLGPYRTGPWLSPDRNRVSRLQSFVEIWKFDTLSRRYARLRRRYPNR